jgi:hypothetical protein
MLQEQKTHIVILGWQDHWVSGICPSSSILSNLDRAFRKLVLFLSSCFQVRGGNTSYLGSPKMS